MNTTKKYLIVKIEELNSVGRVTDTWYYDKTKPSRKSYWPAYATVFSNTDEGFTEAKNICDTWNKYPTVRQAHILTLEKSEKDGMLIPTIVYPKTK